MKLKKSLLTLAIVFSISLVACKKDDNSSATPSLTKTQLLTQHGWKQTAFTLNGIDFFSSVQPCEKDNVITFYTNFNYLEDEGATKCSPSDPQTVSTGTWAFGNNENKLITEPGTADEQDANILQLDATTLKLSTSVYDSLSGNNTLIVLTYTKN
jgi:hypothetical protein